MVEHQTTNSGFWGHILTPRYPWAPWGWWSSFYNDLGQLRVRSVSVLFYLMKWLSSRFDWTYLYDILEVRHFISIHALLILNTMIKSLLRINALYIIINVYIHFVVNLGGISWTLV